MGSIDHIFNLQRLGHTTAIEDGVARLNDWQRAREASGKLEAAPLPAAAARLLSDAEREAIEQPQFSLRDGEHIRDCLLERAISTYGLGSGQTELERVSHLFGHVVRAVGLVERPLHDLPLPPYEFYLLGKGTAEDRAWIFIDVLRQLRIDAVLLFPKRSAETAASERARRPFLVGVLLDKETYLFDPANGVAIPAPGEQGGARPATLAEAAADPALLKQLDAGKGRDYPIAAADLSRPEVALVGDTCGWSSRMQALQAEFVGARAMVVADPLQDSTDGIPGLWSRILQAGGQYWDASDLRLWEYPETARSAHLALTEEQHDSLTGLMRPFSAYKHVARDKQTGVRVLVGQEESADPSGTEYDPGIRTNRRTTTGEQMRARVLQLSGDFADAVSKYVDVRIESKKVLVATSLPAERTLHARAIDDATYWTALCKYEQGDFDGAATDLAHYRHKPGAWDREARYLHALALAAAGKPRDAASELRSVEPDDPEYAGMRLLIRRWESQPADANAAQAPAAN